MPLRVATVLCFLMSAICFCYGGYWLLTAIPTPMSAAEKEAHLDDLVRRQVAGLPAYQRTFNAGDPLGVRMGLGFLAIGTIMFALGALTDAMPQRRRKESKVGFLYRTHHVIKTPSGTYSVSGREFTTADEARTWIDSKF